MTEASDIEVILTVDFGSAGRQGFDGTITLAAGSTALDALRAAVRTAAAPKFGMEHFVESIEGVRNDPTTDEGWQYQVNGYLSNAAPERYLLKNGDWVKWFYSAERRPRSTAAAGPQGRAVVVTGGARSGKSRYAEKRVREFGGRLLYVATAESGDEEMARRIAAHKSRRGDEWVTIEEPLELPAILLRARSRFDACLVDCLTLWISNVLAAGGEAHAFDRVAELVKTLPKLDFAVVLVTNEVGSGIVPDSALARQFRDLAGTANQRLANAAAEVVLMIAGVPLTLKNDSCS